MKNKLRLLLILLLSNVFFVLANGPGGQGTGGPRRCPTCPIDTNEIILIAAAVLLTVAMVAYKKLSLKKA